MFKNGNRQTQKTQTFLVAWMVLVCVAEAHSPVHFLILNTFLAAVPIELGFAMEAPQIRDTVWFWPLGLLWLLFYPNAPYLLTDIFHLSMLAPYDQNGLIRLSISMWINYTFLIVSAFSCTVIGYLGLIKIARTLAKKLHWRTPRAPVIITIALTVVASVGVFIGRFLRIHTVYLLISPRLFITPLIRMWTPRMLAFVALFSFVQFVIYGLIRLAARNYRA